MCVKTGFQVWGNGVLSSKTLVLIGYGFVLSYKPHHASSSCIWHCRMTQRQTTFTNNKDMACPECCSVLKSHVPGSDVVFLYKSCFAPLVLFLT